MQDALHGKQVQRITFTEVTQKAVEAALAHPREIDGHLVNAYKARRALDYLMGYGMSPILWSKLGGARSAGMFHYLSAGLCKLWHAALPPNAKLCHHLLSHCLDLASEQQVAAHL